jgi:hypothetical protein
MNKEILCFIIFLVCASACSKEQVSDVLDDISRDTYEKKAREQRVENLPDHTLEEPLTYDQYQRERKKLIQE